jgi:hypothetical protein
LKPKHKKQRHIKIQTPQTQKQNKTIKIGVYDLTCVVMLQRLLLCQAIKPIDFPSVKQ